MAVDQNSKAFTQNLTGDKQRLLFKIHSIVCDVENSAPDFISVEKDELYLRFEPKTEVGISRDMFNTKVKVVIDGNRGKKHQGQIRLDPEEDFWLDLTMDQMKDLWVADYNFNIENENPRYLSYFISSLEYKLLWLQQSDSGEIRILSEYRKQYQPPQIKSHDQYTGSDIMKCTDMLARAIKKIDLRTGGALIKLNTENGRLESLIIGMASRLGYDVKPLSDEEIKNLEKKGRNTSHSIQVKK